MTIGRRGFLMAGSAAAGAGMFPASEAHAAPVAGGRSITDFGVESNSEADQTEALQKAIDEMALNGRHIIFPTGIFHATKLTIPGACTVSGVMGGTRLVVEQISVFWPDDVVGGYVNLNGMIFDRKHPITQDALFSSRVTTNISNCTFQGKGYAAIDCTYFPVNLQSCEIFWEDGAGLIAKGMATTVGNSNFGNCKTAISVSTYEDAIVVGATIANNKFEGCDTALSATGNAIIKGNILVNSKEFGLKLGDPEGKGSILAQGNLIENCRVGIGVAPSGYDIFASLNMIKGAKDGAIRAFDGDKLVGPDLAVESSEAYLNLTLAGNVTR